MKHLLTLLVGLSLFISKPTYADNMGYSLSALAGASFSTLSSANFAYGLGITVRKSNGFEVGVFLDVPATTAALALEVNYYLCSSCSIGAFTGFNFASSAFFLGPRAGYEFDLAPNLVFGPEVRWLYTFASSSSFFEVLAAFKLYL